VGQPSPEIALSNGTGDQESADCEEEVVVNTVSLAPQVVEGDPPGDERNMAKAITIFLRNSGVGAPWYRVFHVYHPLTMAGITDAAPPMMQTVAASSKDLVNMKRWRT
jgi:hypothetical protein